MKKFTRPLLFLVLSLIALLLAPAVGVAAAALPVLAFLNLAPLPAVLGTSFPVPATTTSANLTSDTAKVKEEKWVRRIIQGSDYLYQDNPLADNFTGRMVAGEKNDESQTRKIVVQLTETEKLDGSTINVPTWAGFGGPIVTGENTRLGNEQRIKTGTFPVTIGRGWFGVGFTGVARDETLLGGSRDRIINDGLRALHAKKKSDDHFMRLRAAAGEGGTGANNMLPSGISTVATLKTANVVDTVLISNLGEELPGLGGLPVDTTSSSGGSYGDLYLFLSSNKALVNLKTESAYLDAHKYAGDRGDTNRIFKGGFSLWQGHGIYSWTHRDHGNNGPIGSPLLPRARLGVALTGANTGSIIIGGGVNYDAAVSRNYFEFFRNAYYAYYNGDTIARVTGTTRHCMIINNDGTGYAVYSYTTIGSTATLADQITVVARVSIGVGTETNTHPQGSLIVECNILGVPIGRSLMLGAQALVAGAGSINGSKADPQMGKRTYEELDHGMQISVGAEGVWGNAAVKRQDGAYPNFILATHAVPQIGAPTIT